MADVHRRGGLAPRIAIGFAVAALLTSITATIVVVTRSSPAPGEAIARPGLTEGQVQASDVAKLKRDAVEKVADDQGTVIGVKVRDAVIREALGLEPDDVITAIGGRAIKREFDVYDAVLGMSTMKTSIVYVDVLRAQQPMVMRWRLDGDLRKARRDQSGALPPRPSGSSIGSLGTRGTGGLLQGNPYRGATGHDPLLDTITKIDEFHYEVPRSTIDSLLANPDALTRSARVVPAINNGRPEGFRLYAIRPSSAWAAIGLENGDTIRVINGYSLDSLDKALEIYTKIKDATEIELEITRRTIDRIITIEIE